MNFRIKHHPRSLNDLVFFDPDQEEIIREYALGGRTRPLLIYGPKGSGKTSAGEIIVASRMPGLDQQRMTTRISARSDNERKSWQNIRELLTRMPYPRGFLQIDDIEDYREGLLNQLDDVLEDDSCGTLILTTEDLTSLGGWVLSRCELVQLLLPTAEQYLDRSLSILKSEGLSETKESVEKLLYGFHGNWYELLRLLESHVIEKKYT